MILNYKDIELFSLLMVVFLYAFSFPYPRYITIIEIGIVFFLTVFIMDSIKHFFSVKKMFGTLIFIYFLTVPLAIGAILNNNLNDMVRDIIPYLYFSLGFIYFIKSRDSKELSKILSYLPWMLSFSGLVYAIRELYHWSSIGENILSISQFATVNYLTQAPIVLFAAIFFLLQSMYCIKTNKKIKSMFLFILFTVPFLTFFLLVLRLPFFLIALTGFVYSLILYKNNKLILLLVATSVTSLFILNLDSTLTAIDFFIQKHELVGGNNKLEEAWKVFDIIFSSNSIFTILFGKGWGALWLSPAVNVEVGYAHSLIVFMVLKLGLIGLSSFIVIVYYLTKINLILFWQYMKNNQYQQMCVLLSIISVLIVYVWFEVGYKTLDFGIILLLLIALFKKRQIDYNEIKKN
jgi:hypothetical protein